MKPSYLRRVPLAAFLCAASQTFIAIAPAGDVGIAPNGFTPFQHIAIGSGAGATPEAIEIKITAVETGRIYVADASVNGGILPAWIDVDGDGVAEQIVAGAGPGGGPHVKVFDGTTGAELASFLAFEPDFTGGVNVAVGDVDGEPGDEIIVGSGPGGRNQVKVFDPNGGLVTSLLDFPGFNGGIRVAAGDVNNDGVDDIITGAGPGGGPHVKVFDGANNSELASFFAFDPGFLGGVSVAAGSVDDVPGDDIIVGGHDGAHPAVVTFSNKDFSKIGAFAPFHDSGLKSVRVGATDLDGDGKAEVTATPDGDSKAFRLFTCDGYPLQYFNVDIPTRTGGIFAGLVPGETGGGDNSLVVGPGAGNAPVVTIFDVRSETRVAPVSFPEPLPHGVNIALFDHTGDGIPDPVVAFGSQIIVIDGATGFIYGGFTAYEPTFTGGVFVAGADLDGDGHSEIITGPASEREPHVRVFDGQTAQNTGSFFAYDRAFTGGVRVATGDITGDGVPDIVTGPGPGSAGPHVKVFDGTDFSEIRDFMAYDAAFRGGVFVAAGDVNGDGFADIVTGPGTGAPAVKVFDGRSLGELSSFFAYDADFLGGVFVAAGDVNGDGLADIGVSPGTGGNGEIRIFSGDGDDLLLATPAPGRQSFPLAIAGRPVPDVRINDIDLDPILGGTLRLQCNRGLFLHLETSLDGLRWEPMAFQRSLGRPILLNDEGAKRESRWFARGRAR